MFSCTNFGHTATRKRNLKHHMKIYASTPATPKLPSKVAHHDPIPNIIIPPTNDHLLQHKEIQSMLNQNTQP